MLTGANVKIRLILLFLIASVSPLVTQPLILSRNSPELPSVYLTNFQNEYRRVINLNGEWNISSEKTGNAKVQVPFCYDFKGKLSCQRNFDTKLENPSDWNYIIQCDGVNYQCEIKINGNFIVKHEGGFVPFSSSVAEGIIKESGNVIEVKIDNSLDVSKTLPLKNTANYPKNYGGIYRDICIIAVPKIFVKSVNVATEIDINQNADLKNTVTISGTDISKYEGSEKKLTVKTELLDTGGTVKASSDAVSFAITSNSTVQAVNKFTVTNPVYWSPDIPHLYKLKVIISQGEDIIDSYMTDFGILELTRKSGTITLNKTALKFKGINYIEEFGGKGICATYSDIERDVRNIKSLGCNIIKLYGRPASNILIDICNKEGLMIMEEIPVFTVPSSMLESDNFLQLSENYLEEMVSAHKNNPCIFAYGIGNDFDVSQQAGQNYVKSMVESIKSIDNRFTYYSTRNYYNDKCREFVDLTGLNFYDGDINTLKSITADLKLKKDRLFISNYGKIINPSNTAGYSDPSSIESQSKYIVDVYKIYKNSSFAGGFFQSYTDWNSDLPNLYTLDPTNPYMRTSGLYTLYREQRPPAIIMRKEFLDEDIPNLNIGTYSKEAPLVFVFAGLITFILFIYLANSVRRFRENVWRALFRPFIFYTDVREQNLISTVHNILLAIILSIGTGLFFANLMYYWKDSQLYDIMLSVFVSHDIIKIYADQFISNPLKLTGVLALITFIKIFLIAFIIWLFSLTVKYRVGFNNIYTVTVWGLLPIVLLLAIGTFYIRILQSNSDFVVIGLIIAAALYIISIYRILKGTYLIFDTFFLKVYAYGIVTIGVLAGGFWFYMNSTKYVFDYLKLVLVFLKG